MDREPNVKLRLFDKPENVRRTLRLLYAVCALLVVADLFVHRHVEYRLENIPAFYALFGFAALVTVVMLAKQLRRVVMRREDYYDVER